MSISLSIASLYSAIFGYESEAFQFAQVTGVSGVGDFNRKEFGDYGSLYWDEDQFGREYFLPVKLTFPDKDKIARSLVIGDVQLLKEWNLPHPVVSLSGKKTIVETPLTERRGTVKELIQIADYDITVRGVLINETQEFPEALMKQMKDVFVIGAPLTLRCAYTDIWLNDVAYQVVIESVAFPEVRGVQNVFGYELRFVSNGIIDLKEIG